MGAKIIKNAIPFLKQRRTALYAFIQENDDCCSAKQIRKILSIDQRSYSRWKNSTILNKLSHKLVVKEDIKFIFYENQKRYGYMRIAKELQNLGHSISTSTTARYMKELGLSFPIKTLKHEFISCTLKFKKNFENRISKGHATNL